MLLKTTELTAALKGTAALKPGRHADGRNLYLSVSATGSMSWVFMYVQNGKRREMGLGSFTGAGRAFRLSLAEARAKADLMRAQMQQPGVDLIKDRRVVKQAAAVTFKVMMEMHIAACIKGNVWKKADSEKKHWEGQLAKNAKALMDMPVDTIETSDVVKVLSPIWPSRGAEVLLTRIRAILNTAKGQGHFKGTDNPANAVAIKAHLKGKAETKNNAALPFADMPSFLAKLIAGGSVAELGLALIALTAVRSGEVRLALRSEVVGDLWTIPAARMKMGKVHKVPLSKQALAILARLPVVEGNPYLFPGEGSEPLTVTAFDKIIEDMGLRGITTVHGLRSTFRDYMGNLHNKANGAVIYDAQSLEFCLAHVVKGAEGAYRRDSSVDARAIIMQVWADAARAAQLKAVA